MASHDKPPVSKGRRRHHHSLASLPTKEYDFLEDQCVKERKKLGRGLMRSIGEAAAFKNHYAGERPPLSLDEKPEKHCMSRCVTAPVFHLAEKNDWQPPLERHLTKDPLIFSNECTEGVTGGTINFLENMSQDGSTPECPQDVQLLSSSSSIHNLTDRCRPRGALIQSVTTDGSTIDTAHISTSVSLGRPQKGARQASYDRPLFGSDNSQDVARFESILFVTLSDHEDEECSVNAFPLLKDSISQSLYSSSGQASLPSMSRRKQREESHTKASRFNPVPSTARSTTRIADTRQVPVFTRRTSRSFSLSRGQSTRQSAKVKSNSRSETDKGTMPYLRHTLGEKPSPGRNELGSYTRSSTRRNAVLGSQPPLKELMRNVMSPVPGIRRREGSEGLEPRKPTLRRAQSSSLARSPTAKPPDRLEGICANILSNAWALESEWFFKPAT